MAVTVLLSALAMLTPLHTRVVAQGLPFDVSEWKTNFQKSSVSLDSRPYGRNPYVGYDDINASPFLYIGGRDPRLKPMERVVTVSIGKEDVAYSFSAIEKAGVVHDTVGGTPIGRPTGRRPASTRDSLAARFGYGGPILAGAL